MKGEKAEEKKEKTVCFAGNPNVGKSTIFNSLTGLNQHTGNWSGKTVGNASGSFASSDHSYILVDVPGTYSLFSRSPEEKTARDFICFENSEAYIAVCDATCLERNLNLVLQILEIHDNVIVCLNLCDEAKRKGIRADAGKLSEILGVPVVKTVAKDKKSLNKLIECMDKTVTSPVSGAYKVTYTPEVEYAIALIEKSMGDRYELQINKRWIAVQLLYGDREVENMIKEKLGISVDDDYMLYEAVKMSRQKLENCGISGEKLQDMIASAFVKEAEKITGETVNSVSGYSKFDRKLDRIFTSRITGYPIMVLLLAVILWITVIGANYISDGISFCFTQLEKLIVKALIYFGAGERLRYVLIEGIYRVPTWIISVMLPPMALFFPMFTLLEDAGYLPRVAFVLDKPFKKCKSCGKQALTMCMGLGCNVTGVTGARIIDSPRERLLAMLTNSFIPCNGRFPMISTLSVMLFAAYKGTKGSLLSGLTLCGAILIGMGATFLSTFLLSETVLKGEPSAYTVEMPPYRLPKFGQVIIRSVTERTLTVLKRAVSVAVPAGMLLFVLANVKAGDKTLLCHGADFLDPFAKLMGLDGMILLAFIMGMPANEIVLPIIVMGYLSNGSLSSMPALSELHGLLIANGWTANTIICTVLFSVMHWPCTTTLLTVKKETGSLKWTVAAFLIPTLLGIVTCMAVTLLFKFH